MDAQSIEQAKEGLAKLVAAQPAEDVWTTPAMEEKLRIKALATQLAKSGDREAQRFVAHQVSLCTHLTTAGEMAFTLIFPEEWPGPADPEALRDIAAFFDTAPPSSNLFYAAVSAVLAGDAQKAFAKLAPLFDAESPDAVAMQRLMKIAGAVFRSKPLRPLVESVLRASARLNHRDLTFAVCEFPGGPPWDAERAHLLALDLPPRLVSDLVYRGVMGNRGLDSKRLKVVLPLLQAEAAPLRDDPAARARIEAVESALKLPGALLGTAKVKLPKAAAMVALRQEVGTEGGPLLALPKEALAAWRGVLLSNGKPGEGDFAGTDYGRACALNAYTSPWGNYGFLDVGEHRGLVLGRRCEVGKLKDGTCLLVIEGDGEGVAALMKEQRPWKKLDGELELPSGQLALFDSAMEGGKTNNKATLKLAPGKFAVDEYDEDSSERQLWILRLTPMSAR
jgi:hypothetical protein